MPSRNWNGSEPASRTGLGITISAVRNSTPRGLGGLFGLEAHTSRAVIKRTELLGWQGNRWKAVRAAPTYDVETLRLQVGPKGPPKISPFLAGPTSIMAPQVADRVSR